MSIFYKQEQETYESTSRNFEIGSAFGNKAPQRIRNNQREKGVSKIIMKDVTDEEIQRQLESHLAS